MFCNFFSVYFLHFPSDVTENRFTLFRNGIAQEGQDRKLVEIHDTDKILIVQNFQRFLSAASGKGIENTVGH